MENFRQGWRSACAAVSLAIALAGCASQTSSPEPVLPHDTPTPLPTPTVPVSFAVSITSVPLPRRVIRRPRPRPTKVVLPATGPYLLLLPPSGPPSSRTIGVRGARLPPAATLQLVWSPAGKMSPIARTAYTDRQGSLSSSLVIPASPPGVYQVVADYGGIPYATARYTVISRARITVSVASVGQGEELQVEGRRFLPRLKLALVAYHAAGGVPVAVLGNVTSNGRGRFLLVAHKQLAPGEYVLRAWSTSTIAAQMAETFFQVVL